MGAPPLLGKVLAEAQDLLSVLLLLHPLSIVVLLLHPLVVLLPGGLVPVLVLFLLL
jgi:hypothetical protein